MIALTVALFGFLLIISPAILAILAGVEDDNDLVRWLMNQSLENIVVIRAMMLSGSGLMWVGALLYYLPS